MNIPSGYRWLLALVAQCSLIGCSTPVVSGEVEDLASDDEFWRTTYCVAGHLPMEVQFSLADNPVRLDGESFGMREVDHISGQVDIKIAALLKESVAAAWQQAYGGQVIQWSRERSLELAEALVVEIAERAPKALGIRFCGGYEAVGNAAYAAIAEYFSRAVQLEGGRPPSWLAHAQTRSNGGIIVMLAVALRLAHIEFDPEQLVETLSE